MRDLFASGRVIDLILALMGVEALALALARRFAPPRAGGLLARVPPWRTLAPNIAAGGFLLLAVRAALVDADWIWVALSLLGALMAHITDLWIRLDAPPRQDSATRSRGTE